jgi:hypothetical protein
MAGGFSVSEFSKKVFSPLASRVGFFIFRYKILERKLLIEKVNEQSGTKIVEREICGDEDGRKVEDENSLRGAGR